MKHGLSNLVSRHGASPALHTSDMSPLVLGVTLQPRVFATCVLSPIMENPGPSYSRPPGWQHGTQTPDPVSSSIRLTTALGTIFGHLIFMPFPGVSDLAYSLPVQKHRAVSFPLPFVSSFPLLLLCLPLHFVYPTSPVSTRTLILSFDSKASPSNSASRFLSCSNSFVVLWKTGPIIFDDS